jgi:hypothetical protein
LIIVCSAVAAGGLSQFCSFMAAMRACIVMPLLQNAVGVSLQQQQQPPHVSASSATTVMQ